MSELSVGTLSGLAANSYVVDIASGSTLDLSNATDLPASALPAGSILQVVSTTKTDLFSTTSLSNEDIPGLSVSITPSSTSSKIFVISNLIQGHSNSGYWNYFTLVRDSTAINVGTGGTTDNSTATVYTANGFANSSVSITALDSPSTTSTLTYKIQMRIKSGGGTGRINSFANSGAEGSSSTITVMEVAG